MTSTWNKLMTVLLTLVFVSGYSVAIYSDQAGTYQDNSLQIPEYQNSEEILYELVAPFIFLSILLFLGYSKVLHAIFRDKDQTPYMVPPMAYIEDDPKPDVRRYAMLMSLTTTAIMVPTPFWNYVKFVTISIPVLALSIVFILFLYGSYKVVSRIF